MKTKIITVDPRELRLLEVNARYMPHEVFNRLVENVKADGRLTSVPFAAIYGYFEENAKPENIVWEVLSGNHRTQAAIAAGLATIEIMVTEEPMSRDQRIAFQLAHNSIDGQDDPQVLKQLYEQISQVEYKMYSGLDDKSLDLLAETAPVSLSEVNLTFQTLVVTFLPEELESARESLEMARKMIQADEVWVARWSEYDAWLDALEASSGAYNIRNMAGAMAVMLSVFNRHLSDLKEGFVGVDPESEEGELAPMHKGWVPVTALVGRPSIPADSAVVIERAIRKMLDHGDVTPKNQWQALEFMAANYLAEH